MPAPRPLPEVGAIFFDARGRDRALRLSWHAEADLVVLSLWRDNVCAASFRLAVDEVPELIALLSRGLGQAYHDVRDDLADLGDDLGDDVRGAQPA